MPAGALTSQLRNLIFTAPKPDKSDAPASAAENRVRAATIGLERLHRAWSVPPLCIEVNDIAHTVTLSKTDMSLQAVRLQIFTDMESWLQAL